MKSTGRALKKRQEIQTYSVLRRCRQIRNLWMVSEDSYENAAIRPLKKGNRGDFLLKLGGFAISFRGAYHCGARSTYLSLPSRAANVSRRHIRNSTLSGSICRSRCGPSRNIRQLCLPHGEIEVAVYSSQGIPNNADPLMQRNSAFHQSRDIGDKAPRRPMQRSIRVIHRDRHYDVIGKLLFEYLL